MLTAIIGTALFVTVVALIAFGLGAIIRHTAGAITSAIGLMFVLPIIIQLLPNTWRWDIMRFFPDARRPGALGDRGRGQPSTCGRPGRSSLVTVIWAVVLVGVGAYLFRKRDA